MLGLQWGYRGPQKAWAWREGGGRAGRSKGLPPGSLCWAGRGCHSLLAVDTDTTVLAGTARVQLCVQGSADLAYLDDGPYEAGGEKEQDPSLIPVPANSYFGRAPLPGPEAL